MHACNNCQSGCSRYGTVTGGKDKIEAIDKEAAKKKKGGARICVTAVLDKSQIGSTSMQWQQITPE